MGCRVSQREPQEKPFRYAKTVKGYEVGISAHTEEQDGFFFTDHTNFALTLEQVKI